MKLMPVLRILLGLCLGLVVSGCGVQVRSPVVPPIGLWYNSTTFPVDIKFGPNNDIGPQMGTAKSASVLGLISWGDCSVEQAAKNGGIKQIDHVDARLFNVLGVYSEYETMVYGKTTVETPAPTSTSEAPGSVPAAPTGG